MIRLLSTLALAIVIFPGFAFSATPELTALVSEQAKVSEEQAASQIEQVFRAIETQLQSGREVTIRNFGKFSVKERAPHTARNPRTGETIQVGAKRYPRFRSAEGLKDRLNSNVAQKS